MILPLAGFLFALIVFGALALLVSKTGDRFPELGPPPLLRRVAAACLYAGLGGVALPLASGAALGGILGWNRLAEVSVFVCLLLGFFGGAALGLRRPSGRGRRG